MELPLRHLSVRVPWHDAAWDGRICKDPRNNASCLFLPRIQTKDVEFEEANKLKFIHELQKENLPPCVSEKVHFLSPHAIFKNAEHPYAEFESLYKHYDLTPLKYPEYSFSVVPYSWMLKNKNDTVTIYE